LASAWAKKAVVNVKNDFQEGSGVYNYNVPEKCPPKVGTLESSFTSICTLVYPSIL